MDSIKGSSMIGIRSNALPGVLAIALGLSGLPDHVMAQTPTDLQAVHFSGEIHTTFPGDAAILVSSDETMLEFDFDAGFADGVNHLGTLDGVDVDAFHDSGDGCGPRLFSLDTTAEIAGTVVRPADIFTESGTLVLDASAEGIPDGVNVDAVSREPVSCLLVFSIDVTTEIDMNTYGPGDLIAWSSGAGFSLYLTDNFDINIDALHLLEDGRTLVSVDTDIEFSGGVARDEDVVEIIPGGPGSFQEIVFSPRDFDDTWQSADLDALWAMPALAPGTVRWETNHVEVFEDAGSISVGIERVGGSDGAIDIDWSTTDGSAANGVDFGGGSGALPLADGATGGSVLISLFDDGDVEGPEDFTIALTGVSGGASLGSPAVVTVVIQDDEDYIFADGFED